MTALPPSPFFDSGATDCPPDEAVAAPRQSADAAADLSCGGVKESPVSTSDYNGVQSPALVTAHGLSRQSCPLSRSETGPQETIDCIGEIFVGARKLMDPDEHRFILDEQAFMDAIDEPPLFLRRA
jgi:hypothetical protein